jgi:hypothetical protein
MLGNRKYKMEVVDVVFKGETWSSWMMLDSGRIIEFESRSASEESCELPYDWVHMIWLWD